MSISTLRISSAFLALVTVATIAAPMSAEAATAKKTKRITSFQAFMYNPHGKYKDEKVTITNPTTRCLTTASKAKHSAAIDLAVKDGIKFGVTTSTKSVHGLAYDNYLDELTLAWEAMNEPYCGFGEFGTPAAIKSYGKSIERVRGRFLDAMKLPDRPLTSLEVSKAAQLIAMPSTTLMVTPKTADEASSSTQSSVD